MQAFSVTLNSKKVEEQGWFKGGGEGVESVLFCLPSPPVSYFHPNAYPKGWCIFTPPIVFSVKIKDGGHALWTSGQNAFTFPHQNSASYPPEKYLGNQLLYFIQSIALSTFRTTRPNSTESNTSVAINLILTILKSTMKEHYHKTYAKYWYVDLARAKSEALDNVYSLFKQNIK